MISPFLRLSDRATLAAHDGGLSITIPHVGRLIVPGIAADHPPIEIETRPLLHALGPRGQIGAVSALDVGPKRRAVAIGGDGWSMTLAGSDLRAAHHHALDPVPPPHVTLDATTLRRAVASLAPIASTYSTALAGIELRQNGACIELAASNGKQLRRAVIPMVSGRLPDHICRAIPATTLRALCEMARGDVRLSWTDQRADLTAGDWSANIYTIGVPYPVWRDIRPPVHATSIEIDAAALRAALRRCGKFVRLSASAAGLTLADPDAGLTIYLRAELYGPPAAALFDPKVLLGALRNRGGLVHVEIPADLEPARVGTLGAIWTDLVMPCRAR